MLLAGGPLLSALIHARLAKRRFGIIARKYTLPEQLVLRGKPWPQVSFDYNATWMRGNKGDASAMPDVKLEITSRLLSHLNHCQPARPSSFNRFTRPKQRNHRDKGFFSCLSLARISPDIFFYRIL